MGALQALAVGSIPSGSTPLCLFYIALIVVIGIHNFTFSCYLNYSNRFLVDDLLPLIGYLIAVLVNIF
jgi:hypothetical protein